MDCCCYARMCGVCLFCLLCVFFFKQKTAYEMRISDWSSDVCSSDLDDAVRLDPAADRDHVVRFGARIQVDAAQMHDEPAVDLGAARPCLRFEQPLRPQGREARFSRVRRPLARIRPLQLAPAPLARGIPPPHPRPFTPSHPTHPPPPV